MENPNRWRKKKLPYRIAYFLCRLFLFSTCAGPIKRQQQFRQVKAKAEALFKILPVPILTYSSDAGNMFSLAKFNLSDLSKKDTVSQASKFSEVVTFSTNCSYVSFHKKYIEKVFG